MAAITMTETSDNPYLGKSHVFSKSYNSDKSKETFTWKCWPQEVPYSYTYYGKSYSGYYTGGTSSKPGGILRGSNLTRYTRRGIFEGIRIHQIRWRKMVVLGKLKATVKFQMKAMQQFQYQLLQMEINLRYKLLTNYVQWDSLIGISHSSGSVLKVVHIT